MFPSPISTANKVSIHSHASDAVTAQAEAYVLQKHGNNEA